MQDLLARLRALAPVAVIAVLGCLVMAGVAAADDEPTPDEPPVPERPQPEEAKPEEPKPDEARPGEEQPDEGAPDEGENEEAGEEEDKGDDEAARPDLHKLYVPFKELADVFEKEGQGVFLPYKEFRRLWERAYRVEPDRNTPPVQAMLRSANYIGRADGEWIRFEASLSVEVLAKGWQRLPLDFRGAGIEQASIQGKPALIVPAKHGYDLLLDQVGLHTLDLVLRVAAPAKGDLHQAKFRVPPVPLARMKLSVPGAATQISIAPNVASSTTTASDGSRELLAFLGPIPEVTLSWRRKPEDRPTVDPLVFASEETLVRVDQGVLRTTVKGNLSILRAPLSSFRLLVPKEVVILYVQGNGILRWERAADGTRIDVTLREPVNERYAFEVGLEQPLGEPPVTVAAPLVFVDGTERETGFLRVESAEGVKVEAPEAPGLIQIDAEKLPKTLQQGGNERTLAYRYPARPGEVKLAVEALTPRITARVGGRIGFGPERVHIRTLAVLDVERAGIFGVRFRLPKGIEITDVTVKGVALEDYIVDEEENQDILRIGFRDRLLGGAQIQIAGRQRIDVPEEQGKSITRVLPVIEMMNATHVRGYLAIHVDRALERDIPEATRRGLTVLDATAAAAVEPPALPKGTETALPLVFRFEHREDPVRASIELERKAPTVTAQVDTQVRLEPDRTRLGVMLHYKVQYRGVKAFRFTAPLDLGERVHLAPGTEMELLGPTPEAKPADAPDGWKPERGVWTLKLPAPRKGSIVVPIEIDDLEAEALESGRSRGFDVPFFVPLVLENGEALPNTVHHVAVKRNALLHVDPTKTVGGAEEIDARELPTRMRDPENFLAFRTYEARSQIELTATKHEYEEVSPLVVTQMHLDSVVPAEGRATTEAYLIVQNNNVQFLELKLPEGARVRAVRVGDRTEAPRKNEAGHLLIPIHSGRGQGEAFQVALVYDHDVSRSGGLFETVALRAPVPLEATKDILTWRVFAPRERTYTGFGGTVKQVEPHASWAQQLLAAAAADFARRPRSQSVDFRRLIEGFESPFTTRHEGRAFHFHGRMGEGTVELTSADPTGFTLLRWAFFLLAFLGSWFIARAARRGGVAMPLTLGALLLLLFALWIPAGIGTSAVLGTMSWGLLSAAVVLFFASLFRGRGTEASDAAAEPPPTDETSTGGDAAPAAEAERDDAPDSASDAKGGEA